MDALLFNQQNQDVVLRAIYASVEVAVRRSARDQREGQSMLFDELCAMERPTPAKLLPRAAVSSRSVGAGTGGSNCRPRGAQDEETESFPSEVCARSRLFCFTSGPDLIVAGPRER